MNEKELYHQKSQAHPDEWKTEVDKLKAKASESGAGAQMEIDRELEALKARLERKRSNLRNPQQMPKKLRENISNTVWCPDEFL